MNAEPGAHRPCVEVRPDVSVAQLVGRADTGLVSAATTARPGGELDRAAAEWDSRTRHISRGVRS